MKRINRRKFLRRSAAAAAGLMAMACSKPAEPTPAPTAKPVATAVPSTAVPATKPPATAVPATQAPAATAAPTKPPVAVYNEAPMLAELVKAGKLPPVAERLPKVPKVANEMPAKFLKYEIGRYGGTLRTATALADRCPDATVASREPLINTPGILAEEFTPNIVQDFKASADYKEFTFTLRQGLKWSDGQPVTMADVRFAVEDVLLNKELTNSIPTWLRAANNPRNNPFTFEVVDDWTFKIKFDKPYGGFLTALSISGWRSYPDLIKPAHYLKPFHKKYADPAKLEAAIKEAKVETWVQLFTSKDVLDTQLGYKKAIGFPMLRPWILKEVTTQNFIFERNPYYFKVDSAGNQLSYIDKVVVTLAQNIETVAMKHIAGDVDFARESASLVKMPLYKENEQKSGFRVLLNRLHVTSTNIYLNLTYKDPVWREVVRNKKFRQALSYAIDRKEIIDSVFFGYAELPVYNPSEYNVAKAKALLDEIGMDKRDSEGFRLGPDGKTFVIPIETAAHVTDMIPTAELFVQYWNAIGIKTTLKRIDQSLWGQRNGANELQACTFWAPTPTWYYGNVGQSIFCPLWVRWYNTAGQDGEEPPDDIKTFLAKLSSLLEIKPDQVPGVVEEIRKMLYDNVYYFIPAEKHLQPLIVNAKLGNVEASKEAFAIAVNFGGEQFFYRQ